MTRGRNAGFELANIYLFTWQYIKPMRHEHSITTHADLQIKLTKFNQSKLQLGILIAQEANQN
jgi:hypothetical protein